MEFSTLMKMIETLTRYRCCKENGVADMVGFTTYIVFCFITYNDWVYEKVCLDELSNYNNC